MAARVGAITNLTLTLDGDRSERERGVVSKYIILYLFATVC